MKEFKIGDKVKCIEPRGKLVQDQIYTVSDDQFAAGLIEVEGISGGFFAHRFVLVEEDGPDPTQPFPDPEKERAQTMEVRLREYRRSLRDMLGQG